jgi:Ser/Thr protein kinase RdoA (MazF antagonist)
MSTIWQPLTPENIFKSVEETLQLKLSNICLRRNSYINRVYELEKLDPAERFIVKFYRPGRWNSDLIEEEHLFVQELFDQEIPVIPPLTIDGQSLFWLGSIPFALFPKKGGRAVDEFDKEGWKTLGRLLARIHLIGALHKTSRRLVWRPALATKEHIATILKSNFLLPDFQPSFVTICEKFVDQADALFENQEFILLHGDCHKGNLINRPGEGIFIIDFDDLCLAPPVQDLWMLLPDTPEKAANELAWFIEGYQTFRPFDQNSLSLINLLRGMRLIHYAAWLSVQSSEPDFLNHFPESGTARYWNGLIRELQNIVFGET